MAKKSQRRTGRHDKAQTGCIWSFISIFDFRNGRSTRRLLSDRRNSRRNAVGTEDFKTKQQMVRSSTGELQQNQKLKENEIEKLDLGKVSVKELMEKEMINYTNGRSLKRNHKRWSSYGSKSNLEVLEDLASGQSKGMDLEAIINDLCRQIRRERVVRLKHNNVIEDNTKSDETLTTNEEKLDEAIQMFVIQKLTNENELTVEGRTDVVRALSSNKDVIIKHLKEQDPTTSNRKSHKILRRSQSLGEILLKEDYGYPGSDRIVILKSGISEIQASTTRSNSSSEKKRGDQTERTGTTHFSFTEIKRRLMNAMTKDRSGQTDDAKQDNVEKISVWNSPIKNRDYNEKYAMPFRGNRKKDKCESMSDIYIEARKHLSEIILGNGGEIEHSPSSRRSPRSLARILSLPEFNYSPMASPRNDTRLVSETTEKNPSSLDNLQENLENQSYNGEDEISKKIEPFPITQVLDEINHSSDKAEEENIKDDMEMVITTDASVDSELCLQVGSIKLDDLEEEEELLPSPLSSSPTSPITKNMAHNERSERPSPVSVLEPTFGEEEDISPSSIKSSQGIAEVQPQHIKFEDFSSMPDQEICIGANLEDEESAFEFVEAALLASDLKWEDFLDRWISSDPVLDPSLIHEVESFSSRSLHDQKLLFDGTNEVLEEVCRRYFSLSPHVSYLKHNIRSVPRGQDLIQEIWEGVESNLLQASPFVLEDAVKRDLMMEKAEKWIDLRVDTEAICFELCEDIFEKLLEEALYENENNVRNQTAVI